MYSIVMGDSTHTLTANGIANQDTAQVTVPAEVQREQDIGIDDEVEVTLDGLNGLFESIAFTGEQKAGDRVTIPAEVARRADIDHGQQLEVTFEKVASDEVYRVADDEVTGSDEVEEAIEEADDILDEIEQEDDLPSEEEAGLGELFYTDDEEDEQEMEEEDEQEDEGLGELFG